MSKKRNAEPLPKNAHLVQFEPGELPPLFVKASSIGEVVVGLSPKILANWRSQGVGPTYSVINGHIYIRFSVIEDFFGGNEVKTFNGEQ
jgi:hypothetical protein